MRNCGPTCQDALLALIEVVAQNRINEVGLRKLTFIGLSLNEFLVVIRNDQWFIVGGKRPRTDMADQRASSACVALGVVALLAEGLPVAKIIGAVPGPWDFVVRAELNIRFLSATGCAFVAVFLLQFLPVGRPQFGSWLPLLAYLQALQLVARAFFPYRSEAFFALQFTHAPENVFVGGVVVSFTEVINRRTDIFLTQHRAGEAMPWRPQRPENNTVVSFVRWASRDKANLCFSKPLLPAGLGFSRRGPWCQEQAFTGARLGHFVGSL